MCLTKIQPQHKQNLINAIKRINSVIGFVIKTSNKYPEINKTSGKLIIKKLNTASRNIEDVLIGKL